MFDKDNLYTMTQIALTKGYKYKVHSTFTYKLKRNPYVEYKCKQFEITLAGWLIIYDTYCYDGASGPTVDTKETYRGSAIHDVLYQLMRLGIIKYSYRQKADREFYDVLLIDGMWRIRAYPWYKSLRMFAGKHARKAAIKKVYRYP